MKQTDLQNKTKKISHKNQTKVIFFQLKQASIIVF